MAGGLILLVSWGAARVNDCEPCGGVPNACFISGGRQIAPLKMTLLDEVPESQRPALETFAPFSLEGERKMSRTATSYHTSYSKWCDTPICVSAGARLDDTRHSKLPLPTLAGVTKT
jgi:hypothetical protein